jgi:3-oxoadipate CoA-transferase, beta subunit
MTPNTNVHRRTREEIAARVAVDLAPGTVVNLGIGMPTLVADHLDPSREILVHSENGILGVGRAPDMARLDRDLINASKDPVTLVPGGSFFNHAESFAMIRGGHIDVAIMGAFEVSCGGDLANWSAGGSTVPSVRRPSS